MLAVRQHLPIDFRRIRLGKDVVGAEEPSLAVIEHIPAKFCETEKDRVLINNRLSDAPHNLHLSLPVVGTVAGGKTHGQPIAFGPGSAVIVGVLVTIPAEHINKSIDFSDNKSIYIQTRAGMKNVPESVESISLNNNTLHCGLYFGKRGINIYGLLSYLTDQPIESVKRYKITRTTMFIKNEGIVYSPMEVK